MVGLSIYIDSAPHKKRLISTPGSVNISSTFSNDSKTISYVEKLFYTFKNQNTTFLIEDPSAYEYKEFFQNSKLIELNNMLIAFETNGDDIINAISNWCYYEIGASIYIMKDNDTSFFSNSYNHYCSKNRLVNYLKQNSSVIISQELDYTVNVCCKKEMFEPILNVIKNETFIK